jgi:aspartate/methionine/tyrosine aminotransferase
MSTTTSQLHTARRFDRVGFSDIVQIRNRVMAMRAEGHQVFEFQGGEPFMETPQPIKDAMTRALKENKTRYAPSSGIAPLREAILEKVRRKNKLSAELEQVIVTNGGMQSLFGAFQSVLDPGDEMLIFSPYWTPIVDLANFCEAKPVLVSTDEARRNGIKATLEKHLTANTRCLYYNSPQNPSGVTFTRAEAEQVAAFAKEHDLIVLADEAYEDLVYDGEHVSIASLAGMFERTITCFTLSKSFAMTGWRLGYVVAAEPFMTALRKAVLYSTNGVSTPAQWAAVEAFKLDEKYFSEMRAEYRTRRELMSTGLNKLGFEVAAPAGAFYIFPKATRLDPDSRVAAEKLLMQGRVATIPGVVFGPHGEGHLRFSFSTSIENIEGCLEAIRKNL